MTITSVAALPLPRSIYIEPTSRCGEPHDCCYGQTHYLESGLENAEAPRG